MRLRAKLVFAFLLLSVLPLAGVTVYTYVTSLRAFRRAVEAEARAAAGEMGGRLAAVTGDLGLRLERVGELALSELAPPQEPGPPRRDPDLARLLGRLEAEIGEAAGLVESLQFEPAEPPPPPGEDVGPGPPDAASRQPGDEGRDVALRAVPELVGETLKWVFKAGPGAGERAPGVPAPPAAEIRAFAERARELALEIAQAEREKLEARKQALQADRERRRASRERWETELQKRQDLARPFDLRLRRGGTEVGTLKARLHPRALLHEALRHASPQPGEIPFAVDADGRVHAPDPAAAERVGSLGVVAAAVGASPETRLALDDWVVVMRKDEDSGVVFGVARPVGEGLREIRRTAARNLGLGLSLVGLALVGVVVLSGRMTRDLGGLALGAERLARGDLGARVPVRSRDEVGRLAETFNRMAHELSEHQQKLLEQERLHKELEMCRLIQEEMLPRAGLRLPFAEVKGVSIPARQVGGDFFNYFGLAGGGAALLVGDVSGKGVPAALLMANLQATLRARLPVEGLASLAESLDREIDAATPLGSYLTLFMATLDASGSALRYVNAGHNPPFVLHGDGSLEALAPTGRPLGLYPGGGYEERRVALRAGDTLFLFTDGLVEAEDENGEAFGIERLETLLRAERDRPPDEVLVAVEEALRRHRGHAEALDDATAVALRLGAPASVR